MSTQEQRDALRAKIEAGEKRNEERTLGQQAADLGESATQFVKDHPVASVAGVAVIGIMIGAMTRPGRRAGAAAGAKASALATYATEMGLAYASGLLDQAGDVARASGDKLEDLGDDVAFTARKARRNATAAAGNTQDNVLSLSRKAARRAGRSYRDAKARVAG
ncbi:hypothetical protein ACFCW2_12785 [Qipengyuania sp. DSG2-2]|uniref:hypothetical protein n=1 Tax=Qipengyuania sp. DGS2-2 TaxID=3349631 RepID=UPI0036D3591E